MADQTLAQSNSLTNADIPGLSRRIRMAVRNRTTWLPPFFRPGLMRESLCLVAATKNWYPCVRGLYFRDRPPMEVEFRSGVRLESSRRDSLFFLVEEVILDRCYTPRWFYEPGPEDIVVDVGANIGVFATHICTLSPGARVACFEPDPMSYGTLVRNVSNSHLGRRVHVHQAAVWREQGILYLALSSHDSSIVQKVVTRGGDGDTAVKCVSLEQALDLAGPAGGPIALLKIDAEGAEADILEGAGPAVMRRIQRVALEYHSDEKRVRCKELLTGYGFSLRWSRGDADTGICLAYRAAKLHGDLG